MGFGALPGKMLIVRIIENNKIDLILGQISFAPQGKDRYYDRALQG